METEVGFPKVSPAAWGHTSSRSPASSPLCGAVELDAAGARLSAETGLPYTPAASGETVAGTYRQRLTLTSGRFAMIEDGVGFALVPWTPALEQHRGCDVSGVVKDNGGIEWSFVRKRGLELILDRTGLASRVLLWSVESAC